jgi:hypothetical protein
VKIHAKEGYWPKCRETLVEQSDSTEFTSSLYWCATHTLMMHGMSVTVSTTSPMTWKKVLCQTIQRFFPNVRIL